MTDAGAASMVDNMLEDLRRRGQEDPVFLAGLVKMAKRHATLKNNPAALLSAVHTAFRSGVSLASKRATTLRRAARRQGPMISCQPTAIERRKRRCGSRRRVQPGRPTKQHSLSASVAANVSGAKKH